jgi:DNA-binding SARP family transcriptional activator/TolB-like protein
LILPPSPVWTLQLLGSPVLRGADGPVAGRAAHKRRIALLCIVALARGRPVGRERLIGLLWPENSTDAGRHSLSEALYVLRKELGDGLVASSHEVRLDPEVVDSDVAEFERALERGDQERAAGVYGGPLLEGFYVSESAEFERWVDGERDRLARLYARALEQLAETAEADGSALRAVDWWRALAVHDPYSSRVALRLIRALDAAGERAAALRYAGAHAALMREELGVDGDPEFEAMVERLRTEPVRTPAPPPPPRFTVGAATATEAALPSPTPHAAGTGAGGQVDASAPAEPGRPVDAERAAGTANTDDRTDAGRAADADSIDVDSIDPGRPEDARDAVDAGRADTGDAGEPVQGGRVADAEWTTGTDPGTEPADHASSGQAPSDPAAPAAGPRASAASASPAAPAPLPASRPVAPGGGRRHALAWYAAALGLAAGLLLAAGTGTGRADRDPAAAAEGGYDPRRIAVLYFDDHSPGEELRYLASGLTESLIHELSQVEALEVVSRNGVKPYRDRAVPFDSIVHALRAGSVVEGSLQQSGDSIFVTVQLIDAATEAHLESRVVGRPMGDVVALQRAVAEEVAASLRRRLGRQLQLRQARAETASAEALALALQGEQLTADASRLEGEQNPLDVASALRLLQRADTLLARAQAADPAWARPAVQRGWVAVALARRQGVPRPDTLLSAALRHADRVLARHPGDARALELRGTVTFMQGVDAVQAGGQPERLDRAERDLRTAVAAEPSLASAWSRLSQLLRYRGRFAEADLAARRALQEDAYLDDAADVLHSLYNGALALGDYPAASDWCERGRARFPTDWRLLECRLTLLREDPAQPQDPALAWELVGALDAMDPPARARGAGRAYSPVYRRMVAASVSARAGDAARARAGVARARREVGNDAELRLSLAYDEAYVRLRLGEREAARRLLDALVAARPPLGPYLRRDPLFRELFTPPPASSPGTRPSAP